MRLILDIALFAAVFVLTLMVFRSPAYAALAGIIIAGAGDTLVWSGARRR